MWLLDSRTLELKLYYDNDIPPYAILSHVWGESEVSFQQINGPRDQIQLFDGFAKIHRCCAQAASDGFEYVWIDTCCIDKTNSAELSEAINSMFKWYRNSTECYIYLADVTQVEDLAASRWFTRGWTLQELIAPESAIFFDKEWNDIGTKSSLAFEVSTITKIPKEVLLRQRGGQYSIAQVMSWAAKRETTRVEDIGYCLLGIFDVHMPMIYGEGEKAFLRLQHEIIKGSTDQSLFAWTRMITYDAPEDWDENYSRQEGAFARSPADFARCGSVVQSDSAHNPEFTLTNKGLRIEVDLDRSGDFGGFSTAYLNCLASPNGFRLGILLREVEADQFIRTDVARTFLMRTDKPEEIKRTTIYIVEPSPSSMSVSAWTNCFPEKRSFMFVLPRSHWSLHGIIEAGEAHWPQFSIGREDYRIDTRTNLRDRVIRQGPNNSSAFKFRLLRHPEIYFVVAFGVTSKYRVWSDIFLQTEPDETLLQTVQSHYVQDDKDEHEDLTPHTSRSWARGNMRDRITAPLQDDSTVNVALKKVLVSGEIHYMVNITIT
ncbi:HET-domain-containing protein [Stipitochalara longipes BDJ]|nr:HET-domain-containing protein [Stipitochalara longipes BDJ]